MHVILLIAIILMARKTPVSDNAIVLDIAELGQTNKFGRIFLSQQRKFAEIPDLLILQKR